ncbi:hypothetical protein [Nocardioides luteus]|uniref:Uncharacterized protein n=1 Tax=Nocardioides luteus TaxID=1844 RepID=A0A1J4N4R2_9ACTN|nr:hypothetical protein [Nocardioides luteus]OIJ25959.1 hypothetical protein UG56_015405 [Nocardioides luteus]
MSTAEAKPEATHPAEAKPEATHTAEAQSDDVTPETDELDEPNGSTAIRKPVEATAPEAVEDEPDADHTSLSLPRISAYGDEDRPGPASSMAVADAEPTERTSRRPSQAVEEELDTAEPTEATVIRPAYAPPTSPPPATPPPAQEPAATESAAEVAVIPDPEPSPIPDPSPFPEPTPVPGPDPVPDPEPTPEPIPEPGPVPEPEPTPEPVPAPEPVSEATAEVAYQPFVQPSGMLVQEAHNGQARHWAPPAETVPADGIHDAEPAYATGYAEEAYATAGSDDWQTGYGYVGEQEPLEQDFGDYGAQQEYVTSLMAAEAEDNPSTWLVLLWVGAIFMIVMLVLGIWLMTL